MGFGGPRWPLPHLKISSSSERKQQNTPLLFLAMEGILFQLKYESECISSPSQNKTFERQNVEVLPLCHLSLPHTTPPTYSTPCCSLSLPPTTTSARGLLAMGHIHPRSSWRPAFHVACFNNIIRSKSRRLTRSSSNFVQLNKYSSMVFTLFLAFIYHNSLSKNLWMLWVCKTC